MIIMCPRKFNSHRFIILQEQVIEYILEIEVSKLACIELIIGQQEVLIRILPLGFRILRRELLSILLTASALVLDYEVNVQV